MVRGYVLVRFTPGLEPEALNSIRIIPGVEDIVMVFGSWDAVVQVEGKSLSTLARLVINQIRGVQGVQATETLVAAEV